MPVIFLNYFFFFTYPPLFSSPKWSELLPKARQSCRNDKEETNRRRTVKYPSKESQCLNFHCKIDSTLTYSEEKLYFSFLNIYLFMTVPSPSFPACSAAPPCRILVRTLSPSAGGCPAAALPIPPGLLPIPTGAALEPSNDKEHQHPIYFHLPLVIVWVMVMVELRLTDAC